MTLLDLFEEHRAAFEYDWRTRFHLPLTVVPGGGMGWGEALRMTRILVGDPTSQVAAAVGEWSHPWSHESMVLANLYDLEHKVNAGKKTPKPYPRPWDPQPKRYGAGGMSKAQLRHLLARHRASGPQPSTAATVP